MTAAALSSTATAAALPPGGGFPCNETGHFYPEFYPECHTCDTTGPVSAEDRTWWSEVSNQGRKLTRSEAGRCGGMATARKFGSVGMARLGRLGYQALARRVGSTARARSYLRRERRLGQVPLLLIVERIEATMTADRQRLAPVRTTTLTDLDVHPYGVD